MPISEQFGNPRYLGALINAMPDGILEVDRNGTIVFVNDQTLHLFGYTVAEMVGQSVEMLVPERVRAQHPDHRKLFFASPRTRTMGSGLQLFGLRKDGTEFPVDISLSGMDFTTAPSAIAVVRDISERHNAQATIHELQRTAVQHAEELDKFFSVSIDMLCISHSDGYFKRISPAFSLGLGWDVQELLRRPFLDFVHPDDVEATAAEVERQVVRGEPVLKFENRYRHKDGSWRMLSWRSVPQAGGYMYAVARDITEQIELEVELRKAKEAAEAANLAKSEFLSRMSHELRTPMNSVLGYAQLLSLQYQDPKITEPVKLIMQAGKHLLQMINEVLDFAKIESGNFAVSMEPIQLASVLSHALELLQPIANEASVQILVDGEICNDLHLKADRQRLLQILLNVLGNALKYNREGGSVRVSCQRLASERCRIVIADTGPGITEEQQKALFQPFHRFGNPSVEGTGLGLALSTRFAAMMGGALGLASSSPAGSAFYLELPTTNPNFEEISEQIGEVAQQSPLHGAQGSVLCIEDNPANLKLIERVLRDWSDLTLFVEKTGLAGFERALSEEPSLILLDLHLPDITGERVLEMLRADKRTKEIPVLILSADATDRQVEKLMQAGAQGYQTKPIELQKLFEAMAPYLKLGS